MGRPSKGLRVRVTTRLPFTLHQQAAIDAAARGMTINDWLVWAARAALATPAKEEPRASTR
jgi:predicted HicB family RNase H-like nuclease